MLLRSLCVGALLLFSASLLAEELKPVAGDWPGWRGANRDGVSLETGLLRSWPEDGPKLLWQVEHVGVGYSSLAISAGRIFTQGDLDGVEHVMALSVEDGRVLWAVQHAGAAARVARQVADQMKRADKNADGMLDEVEILGAMGSRGLRADVAKDGDHEAIAAARAKRFFKALDKNGDGKITFAESGRLLERDFFNIDTKSKDADVAGLAASRTAAFVKRLDQNGDGKLSREEARRSGLDRPFNQIDQRPPGAKKGDELLTVDEILAYLTKYQDGKDGLLAVAELQRYYQNRYAGRDGILTSEELHGHYGGYRNGQGDGPRGTPVVDGKRLYAEGGSGDVSCLDVSTGNTIWTINLSENLGGGRPGWGYSESPLVEGDMLIVTPGGRQGTVAALDKMTGKVIWRSEEETQGAHYASPIAADLAGLRQIVVFASRSVFGVDAATGKKLWSSSLANNGTANCATPLVHGDYVFTASSYGKGGGLVKITASGDAQRADEVYFEKKMGNHHGGMVRVGDYLYGYGSGLICMHYLTGEIAWSNRSVGKGSLVYADGMLYVLSEGHIMGLVEATPDAYREYGRFRIERQGRPSWAHPVVAGGRLYIRDQQRLAVYDVQAK